jgi:hypothetical protein
MSHVSKTALIKVSLARSIQCCLNFSFISFARTVSAYCVQYVHIYTYLTAYRLHMCTICAYIHISYCVQTAHVYNMCIYTHIWLRTDCTCVQCMHIYTYPTAYRRCHQITPQWNTLAQIGAMWSVRWLDTSIYHWGVGLAVTEPTRDIGQNVVQSSFQTGSSCSQQLLPIFFLIAFLEVAFTRNSVLPLIICLFSNNNAVIY